jgi:tetratricopeptide (TPR) repeat protein
MNLQGRLPTIGAMMKRLPHRWSGGSWTVNLCSTIRLLCVSAMFFVALPAVRADQIASAFDAGNTFYELGNFKEAITAYERLLQTNPRSDALWFNLGNAWFKAGQIGRAIAAYREAELLAPRDPAVRFNLQFARKKVSGNDSPANPAWRRALGALTPNEWTVLTGAALWLWFLLLALREWRPALRPALSGYTATTGVAVMLLIGCAALAADLRFNTTSAVVLTSEAIVRSGPLEEAKVLHQFRDGIEVTVLDQKDLGAGDQKQVWLQVRDGANRSGWLKSDQVALIGAAPKAR